MRWFWVDRFIEFESGSHARAVKNVTLAEEHLHDHFPGFPVMPGSLIIEGLAQTGGILLGETSNFEHIVILGKLPKITFHSWACPGDSLTYSARLIDVRDEGGTVECDAYVGDRLVADGEIMFVHLDQRDPQMGAIDQKNFVFSMNLLGILDVGRAGDGTEDSAAES
jgi:3-hydroxyacyl-[acyl-carrier-protein] dehydratase